MSIFEVIAESYNPTTGDAEFSTKTKIMARNSEEAAQIRFNYLSQHDNNNIRIVEVMRVKMTNAPYPWERRNALL